MELGFSIATATERELLAVSDDDWVRYFAGMRNRRVRQGQMGVAGGRFKMAGELARWQGIAKRISAAVGTEKMWR